jgi:hypothetical protein
MEMRDIINQDKQLLFSQLIAEVEGYYLSRYPVSEKDSFTIKFIQAKNFLETMDLSVCPMLVNELENLYGRAPTLQEVNNLANYIVYTRAPVFQEFLAKISALRQQFEMDPQNFDLNSVKTNFPEVFNK